jgi:hypothetical protein
MEEHELSSNNANKRWREKIMRRIVLLIIKEEHGRDLC